MKKNLLLIFCFTLLINTATQVNAQSPFITIWNTANPGVTASNKILFYATGNNFHVGWVNTGNSLDTGNVTGVSGADTITFTAAGTYKVYITPGSGTFNAIYIAASSYSGDFKKLLSIEQWGDINWTTFNNAFSYCSNMVMNATDMPDLSNVTDMSTAFGYCHSLTANAAMNNWNVSNVQGMAYLFAGDTSLNQNIVNWNVSNVTNMSGMFDGDTLFNQPIGNWNVSNVISMAAMFDDARSFNQPISNWDMSNMTSTYIMFTNASSFNQPIGNWDVSNVTDMDGMFYGATSFNQPIGNWNVSNVTDMGIMFGASVFNQPIANWNVSNVGTMRYMFYGASFNQPLANWNVSKVTDMQYMFYTAHAFNHNIGSWNLRGRPNMLDMLDSNGMDCSNYSLTLTGWADSASTPNGLVLGAANLSYDSAFAKAAHDNLTITKGWTITGDKIGNCSVSLPVTFVSFTARSQARAALLSWSVANEINDKGYYIEKSTDALHFNTIGFIAAKGSLEETTYTYTDNNPANGTNYYRIREADDDGKYMYSGIQIIETSGFSWSIEGNPVSNNNTSIELMLNKQETVGIEIISIEGKVIQSIQKANLAAGAYTIPLNFSNASAGLYIVKLMAGNQLYVSKIVK